jgi:hypothetical protein
MLLRLLVLPAFLICDDLPMMIDFQGLIIDRDNVMSKFCESPEALFLEFSFCLVCFFLRTWIRPYVDLRVFQMGSFGFDLAYDDSFRVSTQMCYAQMKFFSNVKSEAYFWDARSSVGVIRRVPLNLTASCCFCVLKSVVILPIHKIPRLFLNISSLCSLNSIGQWRHLLRDVLCADDRS